MNNPQEVTPGQRTRALTISTIAFGICFAVWLLYSILGIRIQKELGLSDTAFGLLVATPILTGSLIRPLLGIWSEMFGGRRVFASLMVIAAASTYALRFADSYPMFIIIGLCLGLAGGSFAVGVVYVSAWFPKQRQGTALGVFAMGNAGAALTSFGAPLLLAAMDWRQATAIYAGALLATAVFFWFGAQEDPLMRARQAGTGAKPSSLAERLRPLKNLQVWRFSMYYFLVFGGFVALTSWLPRYYIGSYGLDIKTAGLLTAGFSLPAAVVRALGGMASDRFGARAVMYVAFSVALICLFLLSYPNTTFTIDGIKGPIEFVLAPSITARVAVLFVLACMMAVGSAAVFKHIPSYYPNHVGAVGGIVGMIGGLGGFFMPIMFGMLNDVIGVWTSCFMLLFGLTAINLLWMHFTIRRMERRHFPQIKTETDLPDIMSATEGKSGSPVATRRA